MYQCPTTKTGHLLYFIEVAGGNLSFVPLRLSLTHSFHLPGPERPAVDPDVRHPGRKVAGDEAVPPALRRLQIRFHLTFPLIGLGSNVVAGSDPVDPSSNGL